MLTEWGRVMTIQCRITDNGGTVGLNKPFIHPVQINEAYYPSLAVADYASII